jgi:hypothetical protein
MTKNKKISGKFAPLLEELGDDQRFILESTDLDKLLYLLIIYTCHMTRHAASKDPRFYKIRYGLRSKTGQIAASMRRLAVMYPKLSWGEKRLSLLNSATYKNKIVVEVEEEVKEEVEVKVPETKTTNPAPRDLSQQICLKSIELTGQTEAVKHKVFNQLLKTFRVRGWKDEPEYVKNVFQAIVSRMEGYTPKDFYPYFAKAAQNYINQNAEAFSADARIHRGQEKKLGITVGSMKL